MSMNAKTAESDRVESLVFTSVQDLQSSLHSYRAGDLEILRKALRTAKAHKYKTKAQVLAAKIKQLERAAA